jgi:hypothetical protein
MTTDNNGKLRLNWWSRGDDPNLHWATGCKGRYVIALNGDHWNVDHRRGPGGRLRRQLGFATTVEAAKTIAQADYELTK